MENYIDLINNMSTKDLNDLALFLRELKHQLFKLNINEEIYI